MKRSIFLVGVGLIAFPAVGSSQTTTPAPVATAKTPTVGATINDSAGTRIGTVDSITPQAVVISTGSTKVAVPPSAIGSTPSGFALSITKAQLEAAQAQQRQAAVAAVQSQLVPGAKVNGINGASLGTVKSSDGTNVTLTTPNGEAKVPVSGFAPGPNNTIVLGLTADQLSAMLGGSATTTTASASANVDATEDSNADRDSSGAMAPTAPATSQGIAPAEGTDTMTSPPTPAITTSPTPTATSATTTTTGSSAKTPTNSRRRR